MRKIVSVLLIVTMLALGACSSKTDQGIRESEMTMLGDAVNAERARTDSLQEAHDVAVGKIVEVKEATPAERILGIAFVNQSYNHAAGSGEVADIVGTFQGATLGTDVQSKVSGDVVKVAPFVMGGVVAGIAIRHDKGSITNKTGAGNIDNKVSEKHSTALGEKSSANFQEDKSSTVEIAPEPTVAE